MKSLRANILEPEVYHLNPKKSDTDLFRTVTKLLPSSLSWYGAYLFKVSELAIFHFKKNLKLLSSNKNHFQAFPLDMSQYSSLFNGTRLPQLSRDILSKDETAKHLLVIRNGHFYTFDVLDSAGDILSPEEILTCLKYILEKDIKLDTQSLGLLTTENRDVWAKAREYITQLSQVNVNSLKAIDTFAINKNSLNLTSKLSIKMINQGRFQ